MGLFPKKANIFNYICEVFLELSKTAEDCEFIILL